MLISQILLPSLLFSYSKELGFRKCNKIKQHEKFRIHSELKHSTKKRLTY